MTIWDLLKHYRNAQLEIDGVSIRGLPRQKLESLCVLLYDRLTKKDSVEDKARKSNRNIRFVGEDIEAQKRRVQELQKELERDNE